MAFNHDVRYTHAESVKGSLKKFNTTIWLQEQDEITPCRQLVMSGVNANMMGDITESSQKIVIFKVKVKSNTAITI